MTTEQNIDKLQKAVQRLEKYAELLSARVTRLEVENKRLRSQMIRANSNISSVEQQLRRN